MLILPTETITLPCGRLRATVPAAPALHDVTALLSAWQAGRLEADLTGDQLSVRCTLPLRLSFPENMILHSLGCSSGPMVLEGTLYCPDGSLLHVTVFITPLSGAKDFTELAAKD